MEAFSIVNKKKGPQLDLVADDQIMFLKAPAIDERSGSTLQIKQTIAIRSGFDLGMPARHSRII